MRKYKKEIREAPNSSCRWCWGRGEIMGQLWVPIDALRKELRYGTTTCGCVKERLVRVYEEKEDERN